tara:strand:- start:1321 stop:2211 length:891 start_codon:yes stop_codon:yes gene_type:complete
MYFIAFVLGCMISRMLRGNLVEGIDEDCDVSCKGLTFLGGPHANQPVCGNEGCGPNVPYVSLETFGCNPDKNHWKGKCCNTEKCPPKSGNTSPPPPLPTSNDKSSSKAQGFEGGCDDSCANKEWSKGHRQHGKPICDNNGCGKDNKYVNMSTGGCGKSKDGEGIYRQGFDDTCCNTEKCPLKSTSTSQGHSCDSTDAHSTCVKCIEYPGYESQIHKDMYIYSDNNEEYKPIAKVDPPKKAEFRLSKCDKEYCGNNPNACPCSNQPNVGNWVGLSMHESTPKVVEEAKNLIHLQQCE